MSARQRLARLLSDRFGIELARGGVSRSLDRFVETRRRELATASLDEYVVRVEQDPEELERLVDVITVVHTWFFRDPGQLAVIESLLRDAPLEARAARVWIAGCATGEDAYSVALIAERVGRAVEVLGTDVNTAALASARAGEYGRWTMRDVDSDSRRFFSASEGGFRVGDALRRSVRFERHNLLDAPPVPRSGGGWDIILCRNVLIYFTRPQARRVFERQAAALTPGGHVLLGASEVVFETPADIEATYVAGRLAFRRKTGHSTRAPSPKEPRDFLIASVPRQSFAGPVPALPRHAAEVAESVPPTRPTHGGGATDALVRGHRLLDQGDPRKARDAYLEALAFDGTSAEAQMYAGIAHYLCGEVPEALHALRAALFLDGTLWPAAFYLALSYESMGHPNDALYEYRNVVRLGERAAASAPILHTPFSAWHRDLLDVARARVASARAASR